MSGIVTSIIAGSGISVNAATGAVTVSATGGGAVATSLVNGTGNIQYYGTNGWGISSNGVSNVAGFFSNFISLNTGVNISGGSGAQPALGVSGNATFSNGPVVFNGSGAGQGVNMSTLSGNGGLVIPTATVTVTRTITGAVGSIRIVTDSPTFTGRVCYWAGGTTWRYISDNSAV
jgi:hypothetical protein